MSLERQQALHVVAIICTQDQMVGITCSHHSMRKSGAAAGVTTLEPGLEVASQRKHPVADIELQAHHKLENVAFEKQ